MATTTVTALQLTFANVLTANGFDFYAIHNDNQATWAADATDGWMAGVWVQVPEDSEMRDVEDAFARGELVDENLHRL